MIRSLALTVLVMAIATACTGPDTGDDRDPTPTPTETATPTPSPTPEPPMPTVEASPTVAPTATPEPTPTTDASPTRSASPTVAASPTAEPVASNAWLPTLAEMPGDGYFVAEEGSRTAQELANAYVDQAAHLRRLGEWGFKQHLYRAFARSSSSDTDTLPYAILTTINEYGSDEQADAALEWLRQLGTATGATPAEAPQIGENAVALTVPTSTGVPTASVYIRQGPTLFVYFGEGGDPLAAISTVAANVFSRQNGT